MVAVAHPHPATVALATDADALLIPQADAAQDRQLGPENSPATFSATMAVVKRFITVAKCEEAAVIHYMQKGGRWTITRQVLRELKSSII